MCLDGPLSGPEGQALLFFLCLYCGSFSTLDSSEKHIMMGLVIQDAHLSPRLATCCVLVRTDMLLSQREQGEDFAGLL